MQPALSFTSLDAEKFASFERFMDDLRRDNNIVAGLEAERLQPYLEAFSAQLRADIANAPFSPEARGHAEALTAPATLGHLFHHVAQTTKNVILSEFSIVSSPMAKKAALDHHNSGALAVFEYGDYHYIMGFLQTSKKTAPDANPEEESVSFPVLGLDKRIVELLASYDTRAVQKGLQEAFTAGNHDPLHHFSNLILLPAIAATDKGSTLRAYSIQTWDKRHFGGSPSNNDPEGYESWLVLAHAGLRARMEEGPEGARLAESCEAFYDALENLRDKIVADGRSYAAHNAVDYLGTLHCAALARFLPLDSSLMDRAISRLREIDPDAKQVEKQGKPVFKRICANTDARAAVKDYRDHGRDVVPVRKTFGFITGRLSDYAVVKKMQVILVSPTTVRLVGPAAAGSDIAKARARTGEVGYEMVETSAIGSLFAVSDGDRRMTLPDGAVLETRHAGGVLHTDDNTPSLSLLCADGTYLREWHKNGMCVRRDSNGVVAAPAPQRRYPPAQTPD